MGENTIRYDGEELYLETDDGAKLIPTPLFSSIDGIIPLSPSLIACISTTEGISIANITLQPQKLLYVAGTFVYEAERYTMANPDVRVEIVHNTDWFTNHASAPDFEIDIMLRNASIVEELYQNGLIADLSSSDILTQAIDLIHPTLQRYVAKDGEPFSFPRYFGMDLIAYNKTFFEKHGYPEIPATMEELLSNLESILSQTELEGEGPEEDILELMAQSLNYDLLSLYFYQEPDTDEPMRFDTDVFRSFLMRIKAYGDQVKSFVETHNLRPMRFSYTEPTNSGDYYYYADFPMDSDDIRYCLPFSIDLYQGLFGTPAMGYMPIAPPAVRPDADLYTGFHMEVATINAQSPRYEEAIRFLEFYSQFPSQFMSSDTWAFLSAGKVNVPFETDERCLAHLHVMEKQLEQYIAAEENASNQEAAQRKLQEVREAIRPYQEELSPRIAEYFSYYQKDVLPTLRLESDSYLLYNVRRIMSCPPFSYWGNATNKIITVEQDDTTPVKEAIINQYAFGEASTEEIIDYLNEAVYEDYQWRIRWE